MQEIGREIRIPLDHLHPNPRNPRKQAGDVTGLVASIRQVGLLTALTVSPAPSFGPGHYLIEAGFRRWTACRLAGLQDAMCKVRDAAPGEGGAPKIVIAIIENVHRENLSAIEEAQAYGTLRDEYHYTQAQIAELTGRDTSTVSTHLALLDLTVESQELVRSGKVSVTDAVGAVRQERKRQRKKVGLKPVNVGWEPLWFAKTHSLASKARVMCDARGHNNRRRLDGVACGQCFETVIRDDQDIVRTAAMEALAVPFIPPTRDSLVMTRLPGENGESVPAANNVRGTRSATARSR